MHWSVLPWGHQVASGHQFAAAQVRGTINWSCPAWLDWLHGGLQFQIEHHLFPRMPRHHLRKASPHVQALCLELGLPYHMPTFFGVCKPLRTLLSAAPLLFD